jgi:hypothetical protein
MIYAAMALQLFSLMFVDSIMFTYQEEIPYWFGGYTFTRSCLGLEGASAVVGHIIVPFLI